MNLLKRRVVADLTAQTGRHDEPHIFGGPDGDPGLIGPGSMSWEIHSDIASVLIAGIGSIVMEILHPSVMAGVQDLSSYREDPLRRGRTTFGYVVTTTFGNTTAATRLIGAVKRMHGRVEGIRPDGVAYRALDPELIGWVHTCIPWGIMEAYHRFNRPLSVAERDRYLAEQAVIGRMGGAGDIPETFAELEEYVEMMRPRLGVNDQTLEFFDFLLTMPFGPPVPGVLSRPAHRFQVEAGMSLMPAWARRLTGFETSDLAHRALHAPALRASARTVRWAFGTPPYAALASDRVSRRPAEAPEAVLAQ
ncbi:MAG: hypothetical protein QOI80_1309 [Solirubrobacteraceae bacterium]|jgi:uncharacterized protein (DUF2236 family)|nr:hypothetical protein [Solirubrobacteraceae bacterium]